MTNKEPHFFAQPGQMRHLIPADLQTEEGQRRFSCIVSATGRQFNVAKAFGLTCHPASRANPASTHPAGAIGLQAWAICHGHSGHPANAPPLRRPIAATSDFQPIQGGRH